MIFGASFQGVVNGTLTHPGYGSWATSSALIADQGLSLGRFICSESQDTAVLNDTRVAEWCHRDQKYQFTSAIVSKLVAQRSSHDRSDAHSRRAVIVHRGSLLPRGYQGG